MKAFTAYLIAAFTKIIFRKKTFLLRIGLLIALGGTLYNLFFGPYTGKLWGISPKLISSDWASQRIFVTEPKDVLFRLLKLKKGARRGLMPKAIFIPKRYRADVRYYER